MSDRRTYVVLGLGVFGSTLAKELAKYNHEVIAIDKVMANVERVAAFVPNALCLDFTDIEQLKSAGIEGADTAIVTTGSNLEQSIIGILNLKEIGVRNIIAKANNKRYSNVLLKIGADETISPDKEIARRTAKKLISNNILELFDIDSNHIMFEMKALPEWVGKTLITLDIRSKYNLNVIGIRRNGELSLSVNPNDEFRKDDILLIAGPKAVFKSFDQLKK